MCEKYNILSWWSVSPTQTFPERRVTPCPCQSILGSCSDGPSTRCLSLTPLPAGRVSRHHAGARLTLRKLHWAASPGPGVHPNLKINLCNIILLQTTPLPGRDPSQPRGGSPQTGSSVGDGEPIGVVSSSSIYLQYSLVPASSGAAVTDQLQTYKYRGETTATSHHLQSHVRRKLNIIHFQSSMVNLCSPWLEDVLISQSRLVGWKWAQQIQWESFSDRPMFTTWYTMSSVEWVEIIEPRTKVQVCITFIFHRKLIRSVAKNLQNNYTLDVCLGLLSCVSAWANLIQSKLWIGKNVTL